METEEIFKECMKDYPLSPISLAVNPILIQAPLPGGATATTVNQLKDMGMLDKFPKVIANMKEVVERGGFATSVTPVSQFYAQQSFLNAITEKPWDQANPGYAKMILGYFGKTPCEPDPELVKWAEEKTGLQPTTEKVVDLNDKDPEKGLKPAEERLKAAGLPVTDENLFIAAACKDGNLGMLLHLKVKKLLLTENFMTSTLKTVSKHLMHLKVKELQSKLLYLVSCLKLKFQQAIKLKKAMYFSLLKL